MGRLLIKNAVIPTENKLKQVDLLAVDGLIDRIGVGLDQPEESVTVIDASDAILLPGFIDIHTHGGAGVEINDADVDGLHQLGRFLASHGVTGYLPTIITDTADRTLHCISTIVKAKNAPCDGASILGIHLEGPYLAAAYKGAMPEHLLRSPSIDELAGYLQAADGCFMHMTVSPELPGMPAFIRAATEMGISVALGHTGADYQTALDCIHAGANCSTHTFNAMKLPHQHEPAACGAILESDVYCEAICDGLHLHPAIVRLLLKTKGYDRVIAVTDAMMAAGLGDGNYHLGVNKIVVEKGDAMLEDRSSRAGSTLTMSAALRNLAKFTNKPFYELAALLTSNPAEFIGLGAYKGRLEKGFHADMTMLDLNGDIIATFVNGMCVYRKEACYGPS